MRVCVFLVVGFFVIVGCSDFSFEDDVGFDGGVEFGFDYVVIEGYCVFDFDCFVDFFIDCIEDFLLVFDVVFGYLDFLGIIEGLFMGVGEMVGSMDVVLFGCGGLIIVVFDEFGFIDGFGLDFIVFENVFVVGFRTFIELV